MMRSKSIKRPQSYTQPYAKMRSHQAILEEPIVSQPSQPGKEMHAYLRFPYPLNISGGGHQPLYSLHVPIRLRQGFTDHLPPLLALK